MDNIDYDIAVGKLTRLKFILKQKYHADIDELIDRLVVDGYNEEKNYNEEGDL